MGVVSLVNFNLTANNKFLRNS